MNHYTSRDIRVAAWQQITSQWWEQERSKYELFTSELVVAEASAGDGEAARERLQKIQDIPEIAIDDRISTPLELLSEEPKHVPR